jgi:hypothetical protein
MPNKCVICILRISWDIQGCLQDIRTHRALIKKLNITFGYQGISRDVFGISERAGPFETVEYILSDIFERIS